MSASHVLIRPFAAETTAELRRVRPARFLRGFGNLFACELSEWFLTRRWLVQALVWLALINGTVAYALFLMPRLDPAGAAEEGDLLGLGLQVLFAMFGYAGLIGVIILAQGLVLDEKQTGTAAWILSKPVSRAAFVLAKLAGNFVGVLVFVVGLPAAVAFAELALATGRLPAVPAYLAGVSILLLAVLFYLSLTLLVGVLFDHRGPVLGIPFAVLFLGAMIVNEMPMAYVVLPASLPMLAATIAAGQSLPPLAHLPIVIAAVLAVLFVRTAAWQFERCEM